ncbi:MAG TPA: ABC-2 transporter permease [Bacillota bacterium]|nr:ABC-2 transporter permease [Bacillota bacterium]
MIWLLWSDLSLQHRSSLVTVPVAAAVMTMVALAMGPREAATLTVVLVTMMAWGACERAAYEDDKADAWTLFRTLPIAPAWVVASRYLSGLVLTLLFGLAAALPLLLLGVHPWPPVTAYVAVGAGMVLTGLFHAVYYRFGYRTVSTWFRYGLLLLWLGTVPVARLFLVGPGAATFLAGLAAWVEANSALIPFLAAALLAVIYLTSWLYASSAFARKELT